MTAHTAIKLVYNHWCILMLIMLCFKIVKMAYSKCGKFFLNALSSLHFTTFPNFIWYYGDKNFVWRIYLFICNLLECRSIVFITKQ